LNCLSMLMGTVVLRDSFPDVAFESFVSSPTIFTFFEVILKDVVFKFTYIITNRFIRTFGIW
jgi:hypothetical protein